MSLAGLREYQKFDHKGYFENKRLAFAGAEEWKDGSGNVLGSKVRAIITADESSYSEAKQDTFRSKNVGQNITIKTHVQLPKILAFGPIPFQTIVMLGEVEKATIYGDYSTELSLTGNVRFMNPESK